MYFKSASKHRILVSNPQDEILATELLRVLSDVDREVFFRLYAERRSATDIERDLGLKNGYVQGLKQSVRARFFEARSRVVAGVAVPQMLTEQTASADSADRSRSEPLNE